MWRSFLSSCQCARGQQRVGVKVKRWHVQQKSNRERGYWRTKRNHENDPLSKKGSKGKEEALVKSTFGTAGWHSLGGECAFISRGVPSRKRQRAHGLEEGDMGKGEKGGFGEARVATHTMGRASKSSARPGKPKVTEVCVEKLNSGGGKDSKKGVENIPVKTSLGVVGRLLSPYCQCSARFSHARDRIQSLNVSIKNWGGWRDIGIDL